MMASPRVQNRAAVIPSSAGFTNHISATIVQGDQRTDEERAQARAAYDLWLHDLRHIRRARPLLDSTDVTRLTVAMTSTPGTKARSTPIMIDLTNLSDDEDGSVPLRGPPPTPPPVRGRDVDAFYRGANGEVAIRDLLSYQKRSGPHVNQYPSPGMLRFDVGRLRKKVGARVKTDEEIATLTRAQLWATTQAASAPKTFEGSLQHHWLKDSAVGSGSRLVSGLPMMEDVVFLRAGNYVGSSSNCFWKAVAYQVYGDHSFDVRVKAEHLAYFSKVLRWPQHPKHALYSEMNKTFYRVRVQDGDGDAVEILANIYQLMTIPCSYTNGIVFEITADLYNLFITVYSVHEFQIGRPSTARVSNITMKGSYNARHVFFLYLAGPKHFQPLVPNEFIASEFRLPRPSSESTYGYPGVSLRRQDRLSTEHVWRLGDTTVGRNGLIDGTTGAPPVHPHSNEYWIKAVINGLDTDTILLEEHDSVRTASSVRTYA